MVAAKVEYLMESLQRSMLEKKADAGYAHATTADV